MRRRGFLAGASALALTPVMRPSDAQAPAPITLRLATNANDDVTPVLWAQHSGMFAKAGIAIDLQKLGSGAATTAALAGGAVDVGKADLLPFIAARSRGIPLQLVAPGSLWLTEHPVSGIVVLKDSHIMNAKDLNGATLSAPGLHDLNSTATRAWTDQNGGDSKTLKFAELPNSAALDALVGGRIEPAVLAGMTRATVATSVDVKDVQPMIDVAFKYGLITQTVDVQQLISTVAIRSR